jgi:hypothetical protein
VLPESPVGAKAGSGTRREAIDTQRVKQYLVGIGLKKRGLPEVEIDSES